MEQLPGYAKAKRDRDLRAFCLGIHQCYFKRFSPSLPENEKPTAEALALVDDGAPIPEKPFPDATKLKPEEFVKAMKDYKKHQDTVKSRVGVSRDHF